MSPNDPLSVLPLPPTVVLPTNPDCAGTVGKDSVPCGKGRYCSDRCWTIGQLGAAHALVAEYERRLAVYGARCPSADPATGGSPDAWLAGFATALAEMHRRLIADEHSLDVCEVARAAGLTLRAARAAGVSSYDLKRLKRAGVR